jgi:hypothetical protein
MVRCVPVYTVWRGETIEFLVLFIKEVDELIASLWDQGGNIQLLNPKHLKKVKKNPGIPKKASLRISYSILGV